MSSKDLGCTPKLLHEIGFKYDCQMTLEAFERNSQRGNSEEYLGWRIESDSIFCVTRAIHVNTRSLFILDEFVQDKEKIKSLILQGIKKDLEGVAQP